MSTRPNSPCATDSAEVILNQSRLDTLTKQIQDAEDKLKALRSDTAIAKYEKNVRERYIRGQIDCKDTRHFVQVSYVKDGPRDQLGCKRRDLRHIFNLMVPYKAAQCECERAALRYVEGHQYPGTTQDQWVGQGANCKGIGSRADGQPLLRVFPTRYSMNAEELKALKASFPGWYIYSTVTTRGHDHPVAHTTTALLTHAVFNEVLPTGTPDKPVAILDVNGNPASNESFMKHHPSVVIDTACKVITPKDELRRAIKWGPELAADGKRRWHNLFDREIGSRGSTIEPERFLDYTAMVMVHVMYYYSMSELFNLLERGNRDLVLYAIVHRFDDKTAAGTINAGEQEWKASTRNGLRWITQTNTKAPSEIYQHPANDMLFKQSSWEQGHKGLSWETTLVAPDTYLVKMKVYEPAKTPLMRKLCMQCGNEYQGSISYDTTDAQPAPASSPVKRSAPNSTAYIEQYESTVIQNGDKWVEYALPKRIHGLLTESRRRLQNIPRTAETFKSHCNLLETKIKRLEKELTTTITFEEADALKKASFWMDAAENVNSDSELFASHWQESRKGDALYKLGHHSGQRLALTAALAGVSKLPNVNPIVTGLATALKDALSTKA